MRIRGRGLLAGRPADRGDEQARADRLLPRGGARGAAALPARAAAPAPRAELGGGGLDRRTPTEVRHRAAAARPGPRPWARGEASPEELIAGADVAVRRLRRPATRARGWCARRSRRGTVPVASQLPALRGAGRRRRARAAVPARGRDHPRGPARAADRRARPARASCARRARRAPFATGTRWPTRSRRSTGASARAATTPPASRPCGAGSRSGRSIHVDLHMHTDHSPDCATPVEVLLATAKERGLGRDRDHRPQRDLRRARGARGRRGDGRDQGDRRRGGEDGRAGRGDRAVPRGEDPAGDDDGRDDRRDPPPGRARLRPAPVRPPALGARLRAPARHGRGDRHPRGVQPAGRADRVQRGGRALRRQVPDRPGRRLRQPRRPGARAA